MFLHVTLHPSLSYYFVLGIRRQNHLLHDIRAQLICAQVRHTLGILYDVPCVFAVYSYVGFEVVCVNAGELQVSGVSDLWQDRGVCHLRNCHWINFSCNSIMQVLKYLDYVFTGVFTFEMVIKVRMPPNTFHLQKSTELDISLNFQPNKLWIFGEYLTFIISFCSFIIPFPFVSADDWPGTAPPPGLVLSWPLEYSGLHCRQRSSGGFRLLVSSL